MSSVTTWIATNEGVTCHVSRPACQYTNKHCNTRISHTRIRGNDPCVLARPMTRKMTFLSFIDIIVYLIVFQLYSVALLCLSVLLYLWLQHYLAVAADLSFALPIFLVSLSLTTFSLSLLACCCLARPAAPPPLGYLVSETLLGMISHLKLWACALSMQVIDGWNRTKVWLY